MSHAETTRDLADVLSGRWVPFHSCGPSECLLLLLLLLLLLFLSFLLLSSAGGHQQSVFEEVAPSVSVSHAWVGGEGR